MKIFQFWIDWAYDVWAWGYNAEMPNRMVIIRNESKERDGLGIQLGRYYHIDSNRNNNNRWYPPAAYRMREKKKLLLGLSENTHT